MHGTHRAPERTSHSELGTSACSRNADSGCVLTQATLYFAGHCRREQHRTADLRFHIPAQAQLPS